MVRSRTQNSIRNTVFSLCGQIITVLLAFACRTIFIHLLGKEYLGYNGLFSDLLTLFSLAELGIGSAITFSMYRPAAVGNKPKVVALLKLYQRLYMFVGIFITIVGLSMIPFLRFMVSGVSNDVNLTGIYLFYLADTVISYFFSYKFTLLTVYQDDFILTIIYTLSAVLTNISQIAILMIYRNFYIYLGIQLFYSFARNIIGSIIVGKRYPFIFSIESEKVEKSELKDIFHNIRAMFFSKVSAAVVNSTDNLLISIFVSTITLGLYSNYILFTNVLRNLMNSIFNAITGSVGNLIALGDSAKIYRAFKNIWFANFLLGSFVSVMFFALINPFISMWIGGNYQLDNGIVFMICLNLYFRLIRNSIITFNQTFGHFVQLQKMCIWEAIINFVASLIYLKVFNLGIMGVLLGTFTSNLLTNWWIEPLVLFRRLNVSWLIYFVTFIKYLAVVLLTDGFCYCISSELFKNNSWINLVFIGIITVIGYVVLVIMLFYKSEEFAYIVGILKTYIFNMDIKNKNEEKQ